jgi:hypothetical protein
MEPLVARLADVNQDLVLLQDPDTAAAVALTSIAWGWDMLGPLWQALPDDAARREYLEAMYSLQSRRGTPWAVKEALRILGWPDAVILDNQGALYFDGTADFNGFYYYGIGFGEWWEWGVELDLSAGGGLTLGQYNLIKTVAEFFAPVRSRLVRIVLKVEDPDSAVGAVPDWTGATELNQVGGSEDGATWTTRHIRFRDIGANSARLDWRLFGVDGSGLNWDHFGLLLEDDSELVDYTRAAIYKASDVEVYGSWTVTWP